MDQEIKERCPECNTEHIAQPMKQYEENGKTVSARPDVGCDRCSYWLRWYVPIFKQSNSGWLLRRRHPGEAHREE